MKLYSKPGACSTADHIALQWTGQPFEVEVMTRETLKSPAYLQVNPAGAVPAAVDGDFKLTQNAAIMGYIADSYPAAGLGGDGSPQQRAEATRGSRSPTPTCTPRLVPCPTLARSTPTRASTRRSRTPPASGSVDCSSAPTSSCRASNGLPASAASPTPTCTSCCAGRMRRVSSWVAWTTSTAFKQRMEADAGVQAALKAEGLA